ncbi:MAG: PAS domain S-box protein [Bacteroidota bacterium]
MEDHEYFRSLLNDPQNANLKGTDTSFVNHLLSILIESSCNYVCVLNSDFEVLVMNNKFCDKIRYQLDKDLEIGLPFLSLLKDQYSSKWEKSLREVIIGNESTLTFGVEEQEDYAKVEFEIRPVYKNSEVHGLAILGYDIVEDKDEIGRLNDKELVFRALTQNLKSAVYTFDEKGFFTYVNPAAERISGYSAEELKQMQFFEIIHPDHRDFVKERGFSRLEKGNIPPTYEFKIISKDNFEKWVEITNTRVYISDRYIVLGSAVDVTERKEAEEKLKVEQAYLERLFENSPEAIVITSNEGEVEHINREFIRLFGYTKEEALGSFIDDLISPDDRYNEATEKTKTVAKGQRISTETVRKHKNGQLIQVSILGAPIEVEGEQMAVYGIYRDISDRVRAQEALKESKSQLQYVLNNTKDIIFQVDLKGSFIFVNKAAEEMIGYAQDELLNKSFYELVVPEYHQLVEGRIKKRIAKEQLADSFKIEVLKKDGERIWLELITSPVTRRDQIVGIQGVARNISQRIEFEEKLKKAKDKAEEADHLKSAFLANMSHEIRTPMNAILGFSRLLNNPSVTKDQQDEYVEIINNRGNQLLQVINDIIDLSRIDSNQLVLEKKEFNLNDFLDELYLNFSQRIQENHEDRIEFELEKGLDDSKAFIQLDKTRLEQIFSYILGNAIKYTEKGMIKFGYDIDDKHENLRFFIQDTGVGIPEEKQDIIFERFRQSDDSKTREYGGTGLGLSISKALIELMGGSIWLKSKTGEGTVFYFSLPYKTKTSTQTVKTQTEKTTPDMKYDWSNKKILIVEDDSLSSKFLETILEDTNATVLLAKDGQEAIDVSKQTEDLDLILMDIQLPGMNGNEATAEIRKLRPKLPIIAQTAHAMVEDKKRSFDAGCDDYITKPINMDTLLDKIQNVFVKYGME